MDSADIYRRLRELETARALADERYTNLALRLDSLETNKIDPMAKQIDELCNSLLHGKGFMGGILFLASIVWALIGAFGAAAWNYFKD